MGRVAGDGFLAPRLCPTHLVPKLHLDPAPTAPVFSALHLGGRPRSLCLGTGVSGVVETAVFRYD